MIGPHFFGLDVLRFIAALLVAAFHFTWHNPGANLVVSIGWIGVEIFFVISGIVIGFSAHRSTADGFIRSRILRLYPAAIIAAALNLTLLSLWHTQSYADLGLAVGASKLGALGSLLLIGPRFLASSYWTLPIEIAFYGLVWVLLRVARTSPLRGLAFALTLASLPYLAALGMHRIGVANWPFTEMGYGPRNMLLLRHAPYFAIGLFIWYATARRLSAIDWAGVALAFLVALGHIVLRAFELAPTYTVPVDPIVLAASCCCAFMGAVGFALISLRMHDRIVPGVRTRHACRVLGLATYPMYLLHEVWGGLIAHVVLSAGWSMPMALVLATSGVLAISVLIATWVEPIVRQWIDRALTNFNQRAGAYGDQPARTAIPSA
jgi:exopolysaccharide production protein ExoZ